MFITLDGVACTTKSTILKRLAKTNKYTVHMSDYKEVSELLELGEDTVLDAIVYTMYRSAFTKHETLKCSKHIFDRDPASSLFYRMVAANSSTEQITKYCKILKSVKEAQHTKYESIILIPMSGQEEIVVSMMTQRGNGIDWLDVEYVRRQCKVFTIWAQMMNYKIIYIDYTKNLYEQQTKICEEVEKRFLIN
ncbi:nicotinamide riboside kinase [Psilogramma increta granulovirus]|uniref:Nicotinamide riboside kinase n=1 Tax=Psilogramma increta granulovirus TaxID=2953508 RepID=A0A977XVX1_9BBAC|nr:nicotinamide riboside kinase [Psilogramma increta granulovirus]